MNALKWVLTALWIVLSISATAAKPEAVAPPGTPSSGARSPVATRSGYIVLKVSDFQRARSDVLKLARKYGADLREADAEVNMAGENHGELMLSVEAPKLDALMDNVRAVGKLYSERVQTNDRTSYYETLDRRAALLRQNETELLNFMRSPRRMRGSDLLFVQYRLYQTRVEEANAAQERLNLARSSQASLLHVVLFEPQPKRGFDWKNWHASAAYRSKGAFFDVSRKLLTGGYMALWFAPLWVPALVLLLLATRWSRRRVRSWLQHREERYANLPTPPG